MLINSIGVTSKHNSLVVTSHISPLEERLQCAVQRAILNILCYAFPNPLDFTSILKDEESKQDDNFIWLS